MLCAKIDTSKNESFDVLIERAKNTTVNEKLITVLDECAPVLKEFIESGKLRYTTDIHLSLDITKYGTQTISLESGMYGTTEFRSIYIVKDNYVYRLEFMLFYIHSFDADIEDNVLLSCSLEKRKINIDCTNTTFSVTGEFEYIKANYADRLQNLINSVDSVANSIL